MKIDNMQQDMREEKGQELAYHLSNKPRLQDQSTVIYMYISSDTRIAAEQFVFSVSLKCPSLPWPHVIGNNNVLQAQRQIFKMQKHG